MTPQNDELKPNLSVIHMAQLEQVKRSERIEKKQDRADEKVDKLVSSISGLTATLTQYSSELRHTSKDIDEMKDELKVIKGDIETLKIDGGSRETRLKMIIGVMAAVFSGMLAWFLAVVTGK